jgi:exosortase
MLAAVALVAAGGVLYGPILLKLARDWSTDPNYSHGFLVLPIAAFLAWERRDRLRIAPSRPSPAGLALVVCSLALLVAGSLGAELFTTRVSLIGVLAGTVLYAYGWNHLRVLAFPLLFLVFMIPIPAILFDRVAVSLQLVASTLAERLLQTANVPVLRDGNVLTLANVTLEVNDACSGIRSMVALLTVTTLAGERWHLPASRRLWLAAAALPIAVAVNGTRVAVSGLAATHFGVEAVRGTLHTATGWAMFVVALACLGVMLRSMRPEVA